MVWLPDGGRYLCHVCSTRFSAGARSGTGSSGVGDLSLRSASGPGSFVVSRRRCRHRGLGGQRTRDHLRPWRLPARGWRFRRRRGAGGPGGGDGGRVRVSLGGPPASQGSRARRSDRTGMLHDVSRRLPFFVEYWRVHRRRSRGRVVVCGRCLPAWPASTAIHPPAGIQAVSRLTSRLCSGLPPVVVTLFPALVVAEADCHGRH